MFLKLHFIWERDSFNFTYTFLNRTGISPFRAWLYRLNPRLPPTGTADTPQVSKSIKLKFTNHSFVLPWLCDDRMYRVEFTDVSSALCFFHAFYCILFKKWLVSKQVHGQFRPVHKATFPNISLGVTESGSHDTCSLWRYHSEFMDISPHITAQIIIQLI